MLWWAGYQIENIKNVCKIVKSVLCMSLTHSFRDARVVEAHMQCVEENWFEMSECNNLQQFHGNENASPFIPWFT